MRFDQWKRRKFITLLGGAAARRRGGMAASGSRAAGQGVRRIGVLHTPRLRM
jgi:hypothetical protein